MAREILIIETANLGTIAQKLPSLTNPQWSYFGNDWPIYNRIQGILSRTAQELCAGPRVNDKARAIRRIFLDFESILSPEQNTLFWQTTHVAEKNPVNNSLFMDICKSLVFCDLLDNHSGDLAIIIEDVFLGAFLQSLAGKRGFANATFYPCQKINDKTQFLRHSRETAHAWKEAGEKQNDIFHKRWHAQKNAVDSLRATYEKPVITTGDIDILTVIWGTPTSFSPTSPKSSDFEFGNLLGHLSNSNKRMAYLVIPIDWQHPLEAILENAIQTTDRVYTLYDCIDISEARTLAEEAVNTPLSLQERFVIDRTDFTPLLKKSYLQDKSTSRQFWALIFSFVAKYFKTKNIKVSHLLSTYENQPWEKSLRYGFKKSMPDTKVCQYFSATAGSFWLSAYPGKVDLQNGYIPKTLSVFSRKCQEQLQTDGFNNSQISLWPAFRYKKSTEEGSLELAPSDIVERSNSDLRLLISLNISPKASLELMAKTLSAVQNLPRIQCRIRFHPRMGPKEPVLNAVKAIHQWQSLPTNVSVSNGNSLSDDLAWADVVTLKGSGVEVEAAQAGCHTIFVRSDCDLDINYMAFEEHNAVLSTIQEIQEELSHFSNILGKQNKDPWSKTKCNAYFEPISDETMNNVDAIFRE